MNIQIILIIIVLVVAFFLALKIFKKIVKAAITVFILLLLLTGVAGIIIYNDAMKIKKGFEGEQIIVITHDDEVVTAFMTSGISISSQRNQQSYESVSQNELEKIADRIRAQEYKKIDEEKFLLIVDQKVFYEKEVNVMGVETTMTQEVLEAFALSTDVLEASSILSDLPEVRPVYLEFFVNAELNELKNDVYAELFMSQISETRGTFLLKGVRNKDIITRPKLISVSVLNIFPESILRRAANEE